MDQHVDTHPAAVAAGEVGENGGELSAEVVIAVEQAVRADDFPECFLGGNDVASIVARGVGGEYRETPIGDRSRGVGVEEGREVEQPIESRLG